MESLPLDGHLARRFRIESGALCARLGPLSLEAALSGMAWQEELLVPAKFALARGGDAELHAEIPLIADRRMCEKLADAALDAALLGPRGGDEPHESGSGAVSDEDVELALAQGSWGFRQRDAGRYQIDAAPAPGHAMRVMLDARHGALRASTRASFRAGSSHVGRALACFGLECNRRLRLARLSVAVEDGRADIVWDAVLAATLPVAGAIPPLVEAVVHAQLLTRRSLAVLTDPSVAGAYLDRRPTADAAGSIPLRRNAATEPSE